MCGRYFRRSDKQRIAEAFKIGMPPSFEILPDYNVAPTTFQPVIVEDRDSGEREVRAMYWGLIPYWAEDPKKLGVSTINAKAESLMEKRMWREPLERRRCLVPADGFYEWQKFDSKVKQPWAIALKGDEPLAFAGLWDRSFAADGAATESCVHITLPANELMRDIHNTGNNPHRMPAILRLEDHEAWLSGTIDEAHATLVPYPADLMVACAVSTRVNTPKNNDASLIEPVA